MNLSMLGMLFEPQLAWRHSFGAKLVISDPIDVRNIMVSATF